MNIHDLIPNLKEKQDLEQQISTENDYSQNYKQNNPLTPITIQGVEYQLKNNEYTNLMQILKETETKIEKIKKYTINEFKKYFGLKIKNNSITELQLNKYELKKIPYIKELAQLQTLNLYHNQITKIEGLETLTKLEYLNLENNKIKKIEGLETLTKIGYLYLSNNPIIDSEENKKVIKELEQKGISINL